MIYRSFKSLYFYDTQWMNIDISTGGEYYRLDLFDCIIHYCTVWSGRLTDIFWSLYPSKHKKIVYNVGPTSKTSFRRCINVIHMFCVCCDHVRVGPVTVYNKWITCNSISEAFLQVYLYIYSVKWWSNSVLFFHFKMATNKVHQSVRT